MSLTSVKVYKRPRIVCEEEFYEDDGGDIFPYSVKEPFTKIYDEQPYNNRQGIRFPGMCKPDPFGEKVFIDRLYDVLKPINE
jgi:hypothetical protein